MVKTLSTTDGQEPTALHRERLRESVVSDSSRPPRSNRKSNETKRERRASSDENRPRLILPTRNAGRTAMLVKSIWIFIAFLVITCPLSARPGTEASIGLLPPVVIVGGP